MEIVVKRDVRAAPQALWSVLVDPVRWPQYTPSIREVRLLDGGLASGSRVRIVQPWLAPMTWTVTEYVEGRELTWAAAVPGVITTGTHSVWPGPSGEARLRLGLRQQGPLGAIVGAVLGRLSRRYVGMEADGLAAAAEAAQPGA